MFSFNPELAQGDLTEEGDEAFDNYNREEEEGEEIQVSPSSSQPSSNECKRYYGNSLTFCCSTEKFSWIL